MISKTVLFYFTGTGNSNENCNFCYACFNYSPVQAIGVKHYTKKLGRYHHPEINSEDITSQHK